MRRESMTTVVPLDPDLVLGVKEGSGRRRKCRRNEKGKKKKGDPGKGTAPAKARSGFSE